jgi:hypothetical protein
MFVVTYIRQFDPTQPKIKSHSKNIQKNKKTIIKITKNTQRASVRGRVDIAGSGPRLMKHLGDHRITQHRKAKGTIALRKAPEPKINV